MGHPPHCAVIGAGFIGLSTALELQNSGCTVTLIDRQEPGMGASFGNAGFIASESIDPLGTPATIRKALPMLMDRHGALSVPAGNWRRSLPWMLRMALSARAKQVPRARVALSAVLSQATPAWKRLLAREGLSGHLLKVHYLRVWEKAQDAAAAESEAAFYREWGIDAEFANRDQLAALEPALAATMHHAVVLPHAHRVSDPYLLCQALFDAFVQRGGVFLQQGVSALEPVGQGVRVKSTDGSPANTSYDRAVVCAGAYSAELLRPFGVRLPLMAERGYHLNLPQVRGLLKGPVCSADRNVFINPLDGGLRVVGFSELGGTDLPPNPARFASLRHHVSAMLPQTVPQLAQASEWMGMRPSLPDSLPVIDTHPHRPQIGFAFGHQHVGVTLAAVTGQLMAAKLLQQPTSIDLAPYAVTRFPLVGAFH